jgi:hypothetical protein
MIVIARSVFQFIGIIVSGLNRAFEYHWSAEKERREIKHRNDIGLFCGMGTLHAEM